LLAILRDVAPTQDCYRVVGRGGWNEFSGGRVSRSCGYADGELGRVEGSFSNGRDGITDEAGL
jgi:hypothetical protein